MESRLQIVFHPDCLTPYHTSTAESPVRVKAVFNTLSRHFAAVTPGKATVDDILRVHDLGLLYQVRNLGESVYQTALLAAGGALAAARLAVLGWPAFAAVRPPGHHAGRRRNGRFCFFNNMAVAAAWILATQPLNRLVIVDIDMHQGDGTAEIFADDSRVELIDVWAPDRKAYLNILFDRLSRVKAADLIAVSAGFDLAVDDWGGRLTIEDFYQIGAAVRAFAERHSRGRFFAVLEGGYAVNTLARNVLAFCQGLDGDP